MGASPYSDGCTEKGEPYEDVPREFLGPGKRRMDHETEDHLQEYDDDHNHEKNADDILGDCVDATEHPFQNPHYPDSLPYDRGAKNFFAPLPESFSFPR